MDNGAAEKARTESRPRKVFRIAVEELESGLDSFDAGARRSALETLADLRIPPQAEGEAVNLHMHTFFSFNASGWSPSRFAWEAGKSGLYAAGIIDFDGLDGAGEFLAAAARLGVRGTAGIEVRAFLPAFSDAEIDSPGEPGVHYLAGSGFVKSIRPDSPEENYLRRLRGISLDRMRSMAGRINAAHPEIAIDPDREARIRTPSGYLTERHLAAAYARQAEVTFPERARRCGFWSRILDMEKASVAVSMERPERLEEKIRGRLMKRGGPGYAQPGTDAFPPAGEVYAWIRRCGAVPMDSWLDGTSGGERRARELLACNRDLGARALNLIPERNWNAADPEERRRKLENLARVIDLAGEFGMPLHIGTEGNKAGLPFVDDLSRPELAPFRERFLSGARILIGHAVAARFADLPYAGDASEALFPGGTAPMNAFYEAVGGLPPVTKPLSLELDALGPERALAVLCDSERRGRWIGVRHVG